MRWIRAVLGACFALLFLAFSASALSYTYMEECGAHWPEEDLPLPYYLNEEGTPDIESFSELEALIQASFLIWEEPCCSSFSSEYGGSTELTAMDNDGLVVVSFEQSRWPRYLGHREEVIAVTLLDFDMDRCTIDDATIYFNNVGFEYTPDGSDDTVHLLAIAIHEVGHLLGLYHSDDPEAIMYAEYEGGDVVDTLHADDIAGICSLYPAVCAACNEDGEYCENENKDDGVQSDEPIEHSDAPQGEEQQDSEALLDEDEQAVSTPSLESDEQVSIAIPGHSKSQSSCSKLNALHTPLGPHKLLLLSFLIGGVVIFRSRDLMHHRA